MSDEKRIGTCKWFSNTHGYGFITDTAVTDKDIFAHFSEIVMEGYKTLKEGEKVEYVLVETDRGPQAKSIKRVS
jgi:cold shock protein